MCVWCTQALRWLSCVTLAIGDLSWWRGLSAINLLNQIAVLVLTHVLIKIRTSLLRALSGTCACAEEGEVQSMHGSFVQQCTQNIHSFIHEVKHGYAIPLFKRKLLVSFCSSWSSPIDILRWVSSGSEICSSIWCVVYMKSFHCRAAVCSSAMYVIREVMYDNGSPL